MTVPLFHDFCWAATTVFRPYPAISRQLHHFADVTYSQASVSLTSLVVVPIRYFLMLSAIAEPVFCNIVRNEVLPIERLAARRHDHGPDRFVPVDHEKREAPQDKVGLCHDSFLAIAGLRVVDVKSQILQYSF